VPAVENRTTVDGHQVALGEHHVLGRNTVHHNIIHRRTDGAREPVVAEEGWDGTGLANHRLGDLVQFQGGDTCLGGFAYGDQRAADNFTGSGHCIDLAR